MEDYAPSRRERIGERLFNWLITYIPSHAVRQWWLRWLGAKIGRDSSIMRGSTVLAPSRLEIGDCCAIGFDVLLDARGGLVIDHDVILASDVHIITAQHVVDSDDFAVLTAPVRIGHHAWLTTRVTVLQGVTIGVGAVVGACSLVNRDIEEKGVVAGLPAKPRGRRTSALAYRGKYRPLLY